MTTKWIEIFRAGRHTDASGQKNTYTLAGLDRIVRTFKTGRLDVPIVVGHPKTADPAWGWVKDLKRVGLRLFARFTQVDKRFWKAVQEGRYKKRSIAVSRDGRLVHVGWLGGMPPAIEGMSDKFSRVPKHALKGFYSARTKACIYIFHKEIPMAKKGNRRGRDLAEFEAYMDDAMGKEKKKRKKMKREMKAMAKKLKKKSAEAAEYSKFLGTGASRKRVKARQKRVKKLVENKKITPASSRHVLAYATALSRETKKVKINGGKKRTLEDTFLRGLERGDEDPIFREFSLIPDVTNHEDGAGDQSIEDVVKGAGFTVEKEED